MKKHLFLVAVIMIALLAINGAILAGDGCATKKKAACGSKSASGHAIAIPAEKSEIAIFSVSKMTCGGCVSNITKALASVEGIGDVKVNLEKGTATVVYDKTSKVEPSMLAAVITKAGYPAKVSTAGATVKCDPKTCKASDCDHGKAMAGCDPAKCSKKDCDHGKVMIGCDPAKCSKKGCDPKMCSGKK